MKKQLSFHFCIITVLMAVTLSSAEAQILKAEVTINTEKLIQEAREKLTNLQDQITRYINDYAWIENLNSRYEIPLQVDIYFERAEPTSFEDRYDARLVLSNKGDFQQSDKRWKFAYQQGSQLAHIEQFNSLTSVLDFYIYILFGQEFDKTARLGGSPYYQKAFQVAQLAKFSEFFPYGWKERLAEIELLQSESQQPLRELEYYYAQAANRLRVDDRKTAGQYLRVIILKSKSLNPEDARTQRFFELRHLDLARMLSVLELADQLQELALIDPAHEVTYREFLKQVKP